MIHRLLQKRRQIRLSNRFLLSQINELVVKAVILQLGSQHILLRATRFVTRLGHFGQVINQ